MIRRERGREALSRRPLPDGFGRRVHRLTDGQGLDPRVLAGALVIVEQGELEIECRAGNRRRFGAGSMLCVDGVPVARIGNAGERLLVLVAVSRLPAGDEFPPAGGSYCDD
jgi:hypothetical protein